MSLSKELSDALDSLNVQIENANQRLKRMPGSKSARVPMGTCPVLNDLKDVVDCEETLVFLDGELHVEKAVANHDECEYVPIATLSISDRIEAAGYVSNFIDASQSRELPIAAMVRDAAQAIEHRLATPTVRVTGDYEPTWRTDDAAIKVFSERPFARVGDFFLVEPTQANRRKVWQGHHIDWNVRLQVELPNAITEKETVYCVTVNGDIYYAGLTRKSIEDRWGLVRKKNLELPHYGESYFIWHSDVVDYGIQRELGMEHGTEANENAPLVELWVCTNPYDLVGDTLVSRIENIETSIIKSYQPKWNTAKR